MSLLWKSQRPHAPGWYWVRTVEGREQCVEVTKRYNGELSVGIALTPLAVTTYAAWAGPIAHPKQASAQSLVTVRYQLHGEYAPPRTHYWGAYDWDYVSREEMLRRARLRLHGGTDILSPPGASDSLKVWLITSCKRNGRWSRNSREEFTKENLPALPAKAAIAA